MARLDLAWPDAKVALEYDGRRFHGPRRIEHDEGRQARLESLGWSVEHVERCDLTADNDSLRRRLSSLLPARAA